MVHQLETSESVNNAFLIFSGCAAGTNRCTTPLFIIITTRILLTWPLMAHILLPHSTHFQRRMIGWVLSFKVKEEKLKSIDQLHLIPMAKQRTNEECQRFMQIFIKTADCITKGEHTKMGNTIQELLCKWFYIDKLPHKLCVCFLLAPQHYLFINQCIWKMVAVFHFNSNKKLPKKYCIDGWNASSPSCWRSSIIPWNSHI